MKMKLKRVMIAAPKSGSGKTMITCALLWALKNKNQQVAAFKCGPDYIDPMFHEKVIGIPSHNLDTFFTGEVETKALLLKNRPDHGFAVLEGVMGLFDGIGGMRQEGSSYHLAKVTKTPIILVVDASGMGNSIVALLAGFLAYDKENLIQGVILNKMTESYYNLIKPIIEEELHIKVLGYVPENREINIESRHLGLVMPDELENIQEQLQLLSEKFMQTVSLDGIMQIADNKEELKDDIQPEYVMKEGNKSKDRPVIAVAKDEAFCFYYAENLRMLQENGAEIQYFSPLHDTTLPEGCNALLLGGGYPELYAKELSENVDMHMAIRHASESKMPIVAECGGFMYLHSAIIDKEGRNYPMAGVLPGVCHYTGKLVRFGYIELQETQSHFLPPAAKIRGHEFHYFDSTDNGEGCIAVKPFTQKTYPCVLEGDHYWLGFPHLYYPSNPVFAKNFVEMARQYRKKNKT